jgi:hypothetical protein
MNKTRRTKNPHIGSGFDDFLKEEGIYEDVQTTAIPRVLASPTKILSTCYVGLRKLTPRCL